MCELFAMSSRWPATVRLSLEELSRHGGLTGPHKDGWGIAFVGGRTARIFKEELPASDSAQIRFIQNHPPRSACVLSHIRKATQGRTGLANCQPFSRELGGRLHVFCHNGDLERATLMQALALGAYRPIGDTDSEHAFCALMERMRALWLGGDAVPPLAERLEVIAALASELRPLGPANFMYTDGDAIFVHGHKRTQPGGRGLRPPGLHALVRSCPADGEGLVAEGLAIDPPTGEQRVVLVASVPLTDEPGWRALNEGEVLVLQHGEIVAAHP